MFVKIKKKCLNEIRRRSQEYLRNIRGRNFSSIDFEIAENLAAMGYDIAYDLFISKKLDKQKREKDKRNLKRNILYERKAKELLFQ
ncbi:MAG: hypothetical protein ACM3O3_01385 [Syntrophothermus sp.]